MNNLWLYISAAVLLTTFAMYLGYKLGYKHGDEGGRTAVLSLKNKELSDLRIAHAEEVARLGNQISSLKYSLDEEKNRQKREEAKRRASPFARDFEPDKPFEVASVPYGTVVCRASVQVSYQDLETLTKDEVLRQLNAEILREAAHYVEVRQIEDPFLAGVLIEGRLRVLERK